MGNGKNADPMSSRIARLLLTAMRQLWQDSSRDTVSETPIAGVAPGPLNKVFTESAPRCHSNYPESPEFAGVSEKRHPVRCRAAEALPPCSLSQTGATLDHTHDRGRFEETRGTSNLG